MYPVWWRSGVVVINGPAITVDMFGNVVKGKINAAHISPAHITKLCVPIHVLAAAGCRAGPLNFNLTSSQQHPLDPHQAHELSHPSMRSIWCHLIAFNMAAAADALPKCRC